MKFGRQEQTAYPCGDTRHLLKGPQGDGSHGFTGIGIICGSDGGLYGKHDTNGSPVCPTGQKQTGTWFIVSHSAPTPHAPEHGLIHLLLVQAFVNGQSGLITHSGRQAK